MTLGNVFYIALALLLGAALWLRIRWELRVDPEPDPDHRPAAWLAIKGMIGPGLLFLVFGPLVGHVAYVINAAVNGVRLQTLLDPGAHLLLAFFAYTLGGVPALLTGALAGTLRPWLSGWRGVLIIGLLGWATTWLLWAGWSLRAEPSWAAGRAEVLQLLAMTAWLGLPAGLVCGGMLLLRRGNGD